MAQLIYVADDEKEICDLLESFLLNAGYEVEKFSTGDKLYVRFQVKPCDLVILDIMMPGTDGFAICKKIRKNSEVPIMFLTAKEGEEDQMRGYDYGVDDYLVKPFSPTLLVAKVKAILKRNGTAREYRFGDLMMEKTLHDVHCNGELLGLTVTEYKLLECLMKDTQKASSRSDILEQIWDTKEKEVKTRVVDETVRRVRQKLKKAGSSVKIQAVWGNGYQLLEK